MSQLPPENDAFTKYYQQYVQQFGSVPSLQPIKPLNLAPGSPGGEKLGFLPRTLDIISRPLRIVTNTFMKGLELPEKYKELDLRESSGEKISAGEKLAPVGDLLAAPFTGFFSDDPSNKPYTSDLIEQSLDSFNVNNPNYVDTENNVNPTVKGVLGFAGDVALDPLTWVPAAWVAKGAQFVVKGAKAAATGAKAGAAAGKEASAAGKTFTETVKETASAGRKAAKERYTNLGDVVDDIENVAQANQKTTNIIKDAIDRGDLPKDATTSALRQLINDNKVMKGSRPVNRTNQMRSFIKEWISEIAKPAITVPGKLINQTEWLNELNVLAKERKLGNIALPFTEFAGVRFAEPNLQSFTESLATFKKNDPKAYDAWVQTNKNDINSQIFKPYYDQFVRNVETNPQVNLFGEINEAPVVGAAAAIMRIAQLADVERANAEIVFGRDLFRALEQMNAEEFATFLDRTQPILSRNGVVESMGKIAGGSPEAKLLRAFTSETNPSGILLPQYRAAVRSMEERIASLIREGTPPPLDDAVRNLQDDESYVAYLSSMLAAYQRGAFRFDDPKIAADMLNATSKAAALTFTKNFDTEFLNKNYEFIVENGDIVIRKTKPRRGEGVARVENTYGTYTQNDFFVALSTQASDLLRGKPKRDATGKILRDGDDNIIYDELPEYMKAASAGEKKAYAGFELAGNLETLVIQTMKVFEDYISSRGLAVTIDQSIDGVRYVQPLRFTDIYETIFRNIEDKNWLRLVTFNGGTGMSYPLLGDAVIALLRGAGPEELKAILLRGTNRWNNKSNNNWLASGASAKFGFKPGKAKPLPAEGITWEPKIFKGNIRGYFGIWNSEVAAQKLADALFAGKQDLIDIAEIRKLQYAERAVVDFQTIAPAISSSLLSMFADRGRETEALLAVNNLGTVIKDFVKAVDVGEPGAVYTANAVYTAIPSSVRRAAKAAEDVTTARRTGTPADVHAARQKAAKNDKKTVKEMNNKADEAAEQVNANPGAYDPEIAGFAEDIPEYKRLQVDGEDPMQNINLGVFGRIMDATSATWGMDARNHLSAFQLFTAPARAMQNWAKKIEGRLRRISPRFNPEFNGTIDGKTTILTAAARNIQQGVKVADEVNPAVARVQYFMEREMELLFGARNKLVRSISGTSLGHSGATLEQISRAFENFGVLTKNGAPVTPPNGVYFDLDKAAQVAADEGIDIIDAGLRQWTEWGDIDDPIRFIAQANAAILSVSTKANFVDNFIVDMTRKGLATDVVAEAKQKGFVRITSENLNYLRGYVPENMFVDKEIAAIFTRMDDVFSTSRTLDSKFGQWWTKTMDPFMQTWKYTITVIRLGHHIRNEIGGQSMRWIALGNAGFAWAERWAYKLMGKENKYRGVDILEGLKRMNEDVVTGGQTVISGKLGTLTEREIWEDFQTFLQASGKRAEDLFDEAGETGAKKLADFLGTAATVGFGRRGGPVERAALGLSEFTENKARFAHYLQVLKQASEGRAVARSVINVVKPKNMAEAREFAIESALRYHPDPLMLTAFEARYGRRIIPFYSWYKQALMALMQSAILNPARTLTTIPKASYNLAIAMGLDPASMYNPFPDDQLFPEFLTEEMTGPQFQYDGKYIAVNPGFANLDVFNQTFTDPIEGTVQMTNPFIRVPLELLAGSRLGSQAPIRDFSDYIDSSIPGINYISNISGRSVTGGFAPQARVESGDKTKFDQFLSAFNWAFGLGVRNYSRESYINIAELELRDEAAKEANQ